MKLPVVALLVVLGALVVPAPAEAAACTGTSGVTVVVDYGNGSTRTGCAPGDPSSGYDALTSAGFSITYAQGSGAGALCQIDNVPGHTCTSMPPANAYWAYFHAARGGSWSYSNYGGGSYDPKPGSVEGWRFGGDANSPPRVSPPDASPTAPASPSRLPVTGPTGLAPTAVPSRKPTPSAGVTSTATPAAGATGATTAIPPAGATDTATAAGTATATGTAAAGAATTTATAAGGAAAVAPATAPLTHPDNGGGLSWIWGVAAVVLLGLAGGITAVRRRQG